MANATELRKIGSTVVGQELFYYFPKTVLRRKRGWYFLGSGYRVGWKTQKVVV